MYTAKKHNKVSEAISAVKKNQSLLTTRQAITHNINSKQLQQAFISHC